MKDFFISYNGKDKAWAEWIAWTLEAAGYTTSIQAWDFRAGGDFIIEMHNAAIQTRRTIAVLSDNYLQAEYTQPEWASALARDPHGNRRTLLPVRISVCRPSGLLATRIYTDLVGLDANEAKQVLLASLGDRGKPGEEPKFPIDTNTPMTDTSETPNTPQLSPNRSRFPGKASSALTVWQEKLEFLWEQEAISADPAQKFALKKQIDEAQTKIADLESRFIENDRVTKHRSNFVSSTLGRATLAASLLIVLIAAAALYVWPRGLKTPVKPREQFARELNDHLSNKHAGHLEVLFNESLGERGDPNLVPTVLRILGKYVDEKDSVKLQLELTDLLYPKFCPPGDFDNISDFAHFRGPNRQSLNSWITGLEDTPVRFSINGGEFVDSPADKWYLYLGIRDTLHSDEIIDLREAASKHMARIVPDVNDSSSVKAKSAGDIALEAKAKAVLARHLRMRHSVYAQDFQTYLMQEYDKWLESMDDYDMENARQRLKEKLLSHLRQNGFKEPWAADDRLPNGN